MMRFSFLRGAFVVAVIILSLGTPFARAEENEWIRITAKTTEVRSNPDLKSKSLFTLYEGMQVPFDEVKVTPEGFWYSFKIRKSTYWIQGEINGEFQFKRVTEELPRIIDSYGILNQPHRFVAKLVKYSSAAEGRLETYEKIEGEYVLSNVYPVTYRREGKKTDYADLRTVGGPVIRYMYRTMQTGMKGRDQSEREFGAFKISYPMPHDALPHFLEGRMGFASYNMIPVINWLNDLLIPHPHSLMGADILIHTARKGSRGCINVENEQMSMLYYDDLAAENDHEIIPLVIYDENVETPSIGEFF
ncbi:MAG: hypothetical protein V1908_04755 [Candidatus Peregrinibacteria bacterium]